MMCCRAVADLKSSVYRDVKRQGWSGRGSVYATLKNERELRSTGLGGTVRIASGTLYQSDDCFCSV